MTRLVLTIVAGSNGCGKTSLTTLARTKFQQVPILDPDAIVRSLQEISAGNTSDIEAGKQVLRDAEELIQSRQSFAVETTLSGGTYLKMAARANEAGFNVVAFFLGTSSVEINLDGVRARVKKAATTSRKRINAGDILAPWRTWKSCFHCLISWSSSTTRPQ